MSLEGRVILVTRPAPRGASLVARLRALGAEALAAPTIEIEDAAPGGPVDRAVADAAAGRFTWVVFTSAAGVRAWWRRMAALAERPPAARVAVVGDATADALRDRGVEPDLVPDTFTTGALGDAFPHAPAAGGSVLLARAHLATDELERRVRGAGWTVDRVDAYRVGPASALPAPAAAALRAGRVDVVTFTSPSTVEGFVRLASVPKRARVVSIGPVTADAARSRGLDVAAVADPHTEDGLVGAVTSLFR